jgi:hypothetical protein
MDGRGSLPEVMKCKANRVADVEKYKSRAGISAVRTRAQWPKTFSRGCLGEMPWCTS